MTAAVFIDRDGVIVEDTGFVHKLEDFKLVNNTVEGLKLLKNYRLFIVTNQSGIGRGNYTLKDFSRFNNHMVKELKKHKIEIQKTYYCPHSPEDNCDCRKPKTKFLKDAEKEFNINLKRSFVVGDRNSDIEFGKNAGCKTIFIPYNNIKIKNKVKADYIAKDLLEAAKWIRKNVNQQ